MESVELHVPPDVAYVGLARLLVARAARQAGMDDARIEDLKIAVSEAATNAILRRQRADADEPVGLTFGSSDGIFQVTVHDTGEHDVAAEATGLAQSPDDWSLGVTVIEGLADQVELLRHGSDRVDMRVSVRLLAGGGPSADR